MRSFAVVGALAGVFAAVLAVGGCAQVQDTIGAATGNDNIFTLAVGDCFNDNTGLNANSGTTESNSVDIVDCSESHQLEIYSSAQLDGDVFPGADAVAAQADDACYTEFEAFAGAPFEQATFFNYKALFPTEQSWASGDREVLCAIAQVDGETILHVTGSLKGAAASDLNG